MKLELLNQTDYADIFGIRDGNGKLIGTVERRLAGCDVKTYCTSLSADYTKRDVFYWFNELLN